MADEAPLVDARAIAVRLDGRAILADIDLQARAHEILAILGPNGAGKSTLLRALAGLTRAEGDIRIAGRALAGMTLAERARHIGYVPQQSELDAPLLVREVVGQARYAHTGWLGTAGEADRHAVDDAMASVDVGQLAEALFTKISHGERRRVLLARALATSAKVILLDEPTAGLDVAHVLGLFETLRAVAARGRAVVVVLHQLDEARRWADRALLLAAGRCLASGAPREVIAADPVRRAYGVEVIEGGGLGYRRSSPP
ncbi:MAG TPA: ABC transporter ATP-binding protein [Polyangia bacterium]|nr:ABC transporter ATP-binding protein [Polyangia bacterium]